MNRPSRALCSLAASCALALPAAAQQSHHPKYDYPTSARADYVIGCLASNDMNRLMLDKCSCGIDTIADLMTYDDYEKASTILSMQQGGLGQHGAEFTDTPIAKEETTKLHAAQAEVNLRCK